MKRLVLVLAVTLLAASLFAGISYSYNLGEARIGQSGIYSTIQLDGTQLMGNAGQPALPWFGIKLLLPSGTQASAIRVTRSNPQVFELAAPVLPLQAQYPFSQEVLPPMVGPDPTIYGSFEAYPATLHNGVITQFLSGHPIAFSAISPFSYEPQKQQLTYFKSITVEVDYSAGTEAQNALNLLKQDASTAQRLKKAVDNKGDVPSYSARTTGFEYLIICDAAKLANWQPLMDFYTGKGYSVYMKPVQEIISQGTGADTQAKIRNFIIDSYAQNSLRYVLLAGDSDLIPHRGFSVNMGAGGESDNDIPADMYYNCLDGTWNSDNDNLWGEMYETDMVPELALGRMCYNSDAEITNQINKATMYQIAPVEANIESSLFVGEWLWDGPTWGGDYMDEMIGGANIHGYSTVGVPTTWNISTLYDRTFGYEEAWNANQIRPLLSQGPNLVNHLGHSNTTYNMRLSNNQVSSTTITNDGSTNNFSIHFSQGCYAGSFDNRDTSPGQYTSDCITEKFTGISTSAAAMIAHSRYGWGMQGSTDGASQYLHRQYIDAIFGENINQLGYTLVDTKIDVIPFINQQPVMYWVLYETNLFGDPAMMIWSDAPQTILAQIPSYWAVGLTNYSIQTNAPGAELRLKRDGAEIVQLVADATGLFNLNLIESLFPGQYDLYINAPNFYNYSASVNVTASSQPYVVCNVVSTDTENGQLLTDNEYQLSVKVKNVGMMDQLSPGTLTLSSNSANVNVLSAPVSFNILASGDSLQLEAAFTIRVVGSFADLTLANLTLTADYDSYSNQSAVTLLLNAPSLSISSYQVNNDGELIMPGDNPTVNLTLSNTGSGIAQTPMMLLLSDNPNITSSEMDVYFPAVAPGQSMVINNAFTINVLEAITVGEIANLNYVLITENDPEDNGSFSFPIGMITYSFEQDFQNWEGVALENGFTNQWHRSSYRNNSDGGGYSAKFGGEGSSDYANSAYGALVSPEMQLGLNSELKFYHWIEAEIHQTAGYAWDGGLVQMSINGGEWQSITPFNGYPYRIYNNTASPFSANTFVYSGTYGWQEASFDLSAFSGSARFRFVFGSDGYTTGEGWYIDDVHLEYDPVANQDANLANVPVQILGNYPNPFNPSTTIRFNTPALAEARLGIYNLRGQLVKSYTLQNLPGGTSSVVWDGLDNNRNAVSSGVYFYRLEAMGQVHSAKMILMK